MNIPFLRPNIKTLPAELIQKALDPSTDLSFELEEAMCNMVGSDFCLATVNAFGAFHLALNALDLKRGDKVIISVNSHPLLAASIRHFDAEPIFIDINEDDSNIDLSLVEKTLVSNKNKKLRGIIVSLLGGAPLDLNRVYELASLHKIFVIEDFTHALGAKYNNKPLGGQNADVSVFSFSPLNSKVFGNGACLITKNLAIYKRATLLREYAIKRESTNPAYVYNCVDLGFDYRLSDLNAAFCLSELRGLKNVLNMRKNIAQKYIKAFQNEPIFLPKYSDEHSFYSFIIRIKSNRDNFAKKLLDLGIQTSLQYIPLHMLSYYKSKYSLKISDFPVALSVFSQTLSIPIYADLKEQETDFVIEKIKELNAQKPY